MDKLFTICLFCCRRVRGRWAAGDSVPRAHGARAALHTGMYDLVNMPSTYYKRRPLITYGTYSARGDRGEFLNLTFLAKHVEFKKNLTSHKRRRGSKILQNASRKSTPLSILWLQSEKNQQYRVNIRLLRSRYDTVVAQTKC